MDRALPDFSRYYDYEELTDALCGLSERFTDLAVLDSIGKSFEGRDLWMMTVTDRSTGPDTEKPAYWLDANIHATEVTGSMGALHLLTRLLTGHSQDESIARLLRERTFYIVPRVNPDGAELALTTPKYLRSSARPYPFTEVQDGLYPEDIDGDGRILQMRLPDPEGSWKVSPTDPRLLVRRGPDEEGGIYYRVYTEGLVRNYDGYNIPIAPSAYGLDLNRSFPVNWQPEGQQAGAGPLPLSEPETRALAEFIAAHPNIYGAISYHTWSGAILRPYTDQPDEQIPLADLRTYEAIGRRGTEITGYPNISAYHGFRYDPRSFIHGVFDDWLYDHLGIYAFTVELWDPLKAAGIERNDFIGWFREHPEADDLKLLRWNDDELAGKAFIDWYPFEHPQLGPVEIGGWDGLFVFSNPPVDALERVIAPNTEFVLAHARMGPRLVIRQFKAEHQADDLWHLHALVVNTGYLPTYGSQKALDRKCARLLDVELRADESVQLIGGERRTKVAHLEGRDRQELGWGVSPKGYPTGHLRTLNWVVRAPVGAWIELRIDGGRAGVATASTTL